MKHDESLLDYYAARAREYEKVYTKPERQANLRELHQVVPSFFRHRNVLELACGTGYWTRLIAAQAAHVTACDLAPEVLAVAKAHQPEGQSVEYRIGDAFLPAAIPGTFDAAFAGFFWSHMLLHDIPGFLRALNARLPANSCVMFVDNRYVTGSNWPVSRSDAEGNTYQRRQLEDGSEHEVLKNFPAASAVHEHITATGGHNIVVRELEYFWCASYAVK